MAFLAVILATAVGCTPPALTAVSAYRPTPQPPPLVLHFAPGTDEPAAADTTRLRLLGAALPAWVRPELFANGPRTLARARAVRRLLGHPMAVLPLTNPDRTADQDTGVLVARVPNGIMADACLGSGQPVPGDIWPADDARRPQILPPGCAVAAALQAQVEAAGAGEDLLRGRPLPPGAATPFADAIERYYRRNDPRLHESASAGGTDQAGGSNTSNSGIAPSFQGTTGQAAPAANPANPLLGPLPDASAPPRQGAR